MEQTQTIGEGLTFEKVWAAIQGTRFVEARPVGEVCDCTGTGKR
jgi:hypothetical protein